VVLTVEEAARISYYCLWHDENEMYVVFNRHIHKYVSTMNNEDVLKATIGYVQETCGVKRFVNVRTGRLLICYVITSEEVEVVPA